MITAFPPLVAVALACANSRAPDNGSSVVSIKPPDTPPGSNDNRPKANRWRYSHYADEMGRGFITEMDIVSTNTLSLGFPYEGAQHATLYIREHPHYGKDVILTIEKGQLLDSNNHGKVLVRFDEDRPRSFSSVRPADLSSDMLFLRGGAFPVFVSRLKTAKTLRIEVPVYQAGNQMLVFDVEGFTWEK